MRDTSAALDKMRQSGSQLAAGINPAAARVDALAAAQSKARGSASELAASHRELVGAARDAAGGVGALNQKLANMSAAKEHARALTAEVDKLGTSLIRVGAVGIGAMGFAVKESMSLSRAMGLVSARTRASSDEMKALRKNALDLGNDNRFTALSAADVGRGQAALATGGLTPAQIVGGAAEGAAAGAIVGGTEMVESAELMIDVLKTFRLQADQSLSAMDAISAAASGSATNFGELSAALRMGGGAAQDLRRPMHETIGTLALMADHMMRGSDAGTAYKTFMLSLSGNSDQAKDAMKAHNLELADGAGKFKSMSTIAEELKTKLGGLSEANRTAALKQIFGNDAYRVASALMDEGAAGVDKYEKMVSRAGASVESATRQQEGLHGAIDALISTAQTSATVFGNELAPAVIGVANAASGLVKKLGDADSGTARFGRTTAAATSVLLVAGGAYFKVNAAVVAYRANLAILRTHTDAAAASQGRLNTALNAAKFGAVAIAASGLVYMINEVDRANNRALQGMDDYNDKLREMEAQGYLTADALKRLSVDSAQLPTGLDRWKTVYGEALLDSKMRAFDIHHPSATAAERQAREERERAALPKWTQGALQREDYEQRKFAEPTLLSAAERAALKKQREDAKAGQGRLPADLEKALSGLGGDGKSGGGSAAAKKQKTAAELQAEADEKLLKAKQEQLAAVDAQLRIIKAGGAAAAEQTNKTQAAARIAGDAVESGRVFNKKQLQCAEAVSTIYKEAGVLSQVYTVTTQASKAMLEHPDRFQRLSPGAALRPGDYVAKPYKSGVGAFSGDAGWHAMMVTDQGKVAGAPNAGSTFQNQGSQSKLPSGWVGFRPKSGAAGGDTAGLEAQKKRLEDDIAGLQGGAASLQLQAERAESAAKAQQEASEAAKQAADEAKKAAEEQRQAQIDKIQREGAGKMVRAEAGIWQAEQGRSLAGQGQQSQAFQEVIAAHEAFWAAREETARALAAITGDTTELERTQLETERERSQLLDDEIAKQRAIREEKRRQREEAEKQAKEARLQKSGDAATLADIMAERAKIQGASAQTQAALEKKQQGLQLRHAAELARQGQVVEAERIRNEVLREQMEGSKAGKDALKEAVIGGDMGRISDILQQARRTGGPSAGSGQGDDDPVAYAIRNGRSQQPRIIAGAVDERLRREALETARLIEDS
ncbi:MAG: phage tail tape measure protein [Rhodobacterales bacterium]|nr:phage tail tape measure protein [Rhodobacterales bacterium]